MFLTRTRPRTVSPGPAPYRKYDGNPTASIEKPSGSGRWACAGEPMRRGTAASRPPPLRSFAIIAAGYGLTPSVEVIVLV
jgi:hypothetical protein